VNDVLVDERKIGGVLTSTQTQGDRVTAVLVGIGLNVATAPAVPPTPFVPRVGCLADAGTQATWDAAMVAVLAALGRRLTDLALHGPAALLDAYHDSSLVVGREVCVVADTGPGDARVEVRPAPILRGTVRAISADLSLVLEGVEAPVTSGRLAFAGDWDRFERG
jgi:biotin-(acetyl-CoA carboxylase) ligase